MTDAAHHDTPLHIASRHLIMQQSATPLAALHRAVQLHGETSHGVTLRNTAQHRASQHFVARHTAPPRHAAIRFTPQRKDLGHENSHR